MWQKSNTNPSTAGRNARHDNSWVTVTANVNTPAEYKAKKKPCQLSAYKQNTLYICKLPNGGAPQRIAICDIRASYRPS